MEVIKLQFRDTYKVQDGYSVDIIKYYTFNKDKVHYFDILEYPFNKIDSFNFNIKNSPTSKLPCSQSESEGG